MSNKLKITKILVSQSQKRVKNKLQNEFKHLAGKPMTELNEAIINDVASFHIKKEIILNDKLGLHVKI